MITLSIILAVVITTSFFIIRNLIIKNEDVITIANDINNIILSVVIFNL